MQPTSETQGISEDVYKAVSGSVDADLVEQLTEEELPEESEYNLRLASNILRRRAILSGEDTSAEKLN